jgi:hypothetical protein
MAKLSTAARKALPASAFAGPGRSFPVEDKNHAVAAKSFAKRAYNKGSLSLSELNRITAKANRKLKNC